MEKKAVPNLSDHHKKLSRETYMYYTVQCVCRTRIVSRVGNTLSGFLSKSLFFAKKWATERFAKKNERFAHLLIFGEWHEQFPHGCSFLVWTWAILSQLLFCHERHDWFSFKNRKWANRSFFLKLTTIQYLFKMYKSTIFF